MITKSIDPPSRLDSRKLKMVTKRSDYEKQLGTETLIEKNYTRNAE